MESEQVDRFHEECGVFGVHAPGRAVASLTYLGLSALQHRGEESAGIAVSDGDRIRVRKDSGLVAQVFDRETLLALEGDISLGHTRYSTTGVSQPSNAQPMCFEHGQLGTIAFGHNGNLVNTSELRADLRKQGAVLHTDTDSEVIGALLARTPGETLELVLRRTLPRLEGAYSLLFLTRDSLVAARDSLGIRPLCLGRLPQAGTRRDAGYVITSETCALDVISAELIRDIEPGEIVTVGHAGITSASISTKKAPATAFCTFEHIYFSRADSIMQGRPLYEVRSAMGRELAHEASVEADIVMALPDSGTPQAMGYAELSGIPFVEGVIRSRYMTRTFIQPSQKEREASILLKFNPMRHVLQGKRVVLVDDSIVRGTTSRRIVRELRRAGAREVHVRVASPPIMWPCFLGIDIRSRGECIAAGRTNDEVCALIGADTLGYLSMSGLQRVLRAQSGTGFCFGCFNGAYPVRVPQGIERDAATPAAGAFRLTLEAPGRCVLPAPVRPGVPPG